MGWLELIVVAVLLAFTLLVVMALVGFVWQLFAGSKPNRRHK